MRGGKKRLPPTEWESEAAAPETSSSVASKRPKVPALTGLVSVFLNFVILDRELIICFVLF